MQILSGEVQKNKRPKPILGLLQTTKSFLKQKLENNVDFNDVENPNLFETMERTINDDTNAVFNHVIDKNPIINKRILLKVNYEQSNNIETEFKDDGKQMLDEMKAKDFESETHDAPNENVVYDKIKVIKPYSAAAAAAGAAPSNGENYIQHSNEGRIVVYGDSNCLDSTHIEKPCFWLLDALLEYTMTSHISAILKDLNRSPNVRFSSKLMSMPKRLPNNNLHLYSKVLHPATTNDVLSTGAVNDGLTKPNTQTKRPIPICNRLQWETPIFLNISSPTDFHMQKDDLDSHNAQAVELNLRRKLESQKGEVRSGKKVKRNKYEALYFQNYNDNIIFPIGNMILDDNDLPMKSWRNKNRSGDVVISPNIDHSDDKAEAISKNDANNVGDSSDIHHSPFQLPQLTNSIQMKEESFSLTMYILLVLTFIVITLFLNSIRKRSNTIRTRRKWFPFNKLGF